MAMNGMGMMLKAFGVNITPEQIKMLEGFIPQIPERSQQAVAVISAMANMVQGYDARLVVLEQSQIELHRKLDLMIEHQLKMEERYGHAARGGDNADTSRANGTTKRTAARTT